MKTGILLAFVALASSHALFAQSDDPDRLIERAHHENEITRLRMRAEDTEEEARRARAAKAAGASDLLPNFPEAPSKSFRYRHGGYEQAILNYENQLRVRGLTATPEIEAQIEDAHRRLAGVSVVDWNARKAKNNAFDNGTFRNPSPHKAQEPLSRVPDAPRVDLNSAWKASGSIALRRYPQIADAASPLAERYLAIRQRLVDQHSPILTQPNAPERIADLAAGELRILPKE